MVLKVDVPPELVHGDVAPGYGPVADAFAASFAHRGEIGAACAVYRDGEKVVDLWGGYRDGRSRAPWQEDTLVPVFSTTKGDVTVRQLLSHQGGLPTIDAPLSLADLDVVAAALAAQAPAWEPGTRHGYHGQSLGWYEGELVRRADPAGRTLGRFFAEEVAAPLDAEFHVGVAPGAVDRERIATIHGFATWEMFAHLGSLPAPFVVAFATPRSLTARSFANPAALSTVEAFSATASPPRDGVRDQVLRVDTSFSPGYVKPFPRFRFGGADGRAFGTTGLGGSFAFADPQTGVGFAYAMNRTGFHLWDDPREVALRDALSSTVLGEAPQRPDAAGGRARASSSAGTRQAAGAAGSSSSPSRRRSPWVSSRQG